MYYCIGALEIADAKRFSCHQSKATESAKLRFFEIRPDPSYLKHGKIGRLFQTL